MKGRNILGENYSACWKFMRECRWFFVFAFGLFALMFLIGFAYPVFFREEIFMMIESLILGIEGLSVMGLIGFIFLNNLTASFLAMGLGILVGLFPLMTVVVNGYLLGFVAREAVMREGIFVLWRIFPHGIFELPAILISIGMGLRLGLSVVRGFGGSDDKGSVGYVFRESLRVFVFVVFPLLVLAGVIEGLLIGLM